MHIKFNYLYRDAGNYKNHGFVIFSNRNNLSLGKIEQLIRGHLSDSEFFCAEQLVNPLFFVDHDEELDHEWHEFGSVELTEEEPTDPRNIEEFIADLQLYAKSA